MSNDKREGAEVPPDRDPTWVGWVQAQLLEWYQLAGRRLPWRGDRDPYRVLVSELMLVQTTVAAVVPHFQRFLRRFPDVWALAAAEEGEVLKVWEGLGYYRRARQLHLAARQIVERYGGLIPPDRAAIRELPGVGRYISGAVLSLAFDLPEPILEANSARVLARLLGWRQELGSTASRKRLWEAASRLVPGKGSGAFNSALMDLGSLVCTPRNPRCLLCPVASACQARRLGLQDELPPASSRPPMGIGTEMSTLIRWQDRVLLVQRAPSLGLWAGLWEFPTVGLTGANPAGRERGDPSKLERAFKRTVGIRIAVGPEVFRFKYTVTRYRLELRAHLAARLGGEVRLGRGLVRGEWVKAAELERFPLGGPARRIARWMTQTGGHLEGPWSD